MMSVVKLIKVIFISLSVIFCTPSLAASEAEKLMHQYKAALVQVKLVGKASGDKSSIGSGFFVDANGLVATNYHVVSDKVQHYDQYELQYELHTGERGSASLIDIDVVSDLALIKIDKPAKAFFKLNKNKPKRGENIFSLGNPHDLGMLVVPGTYNGLVKGNFKDEINFTGAINSGMSGGPAVNQRGEVVGVNVASAGNQLGFLVPVQKLIRLIEHSKTRTLKLQADFLALIETQLVQHQNVLLNDVLAQDWKKETLEGIELPGEIRPYVKCWGGSNFKNKIEKKLLYDSVQRACATKQEIYIDNDFVIGKLELYFTLLASEQLDELRFYNLVSENFIGYRSPTAASREFVSRFYCSEKIINEGKKEKAVYCIRQFKKFKSLYDVVYVSATLDQKNKSLISHFTLSGVNQENAKKFLTRFVKEVQWK